MADRIDARSHITLYLRTGRPRCLRTALHLHRVLLLGASHRRLGHRAHVHAPQSQPPVPACGNQGDLAQEPTNDGLCDTIRHLVRHSGPRLEGIRIRAGNPVPRLCRSDSPQHVPPPRQLTADFGDAADAAHSFRDTPAVLQLAGTEPAFRSERLPADVLHHRIHIRTGMGLIRVPGQAMAAGPRQRYSATRRHTGCSVCPPVLRGLQWLGHPVHRRLLLLQEQDIRHHR